MVKAGRDRTEKAGVPLDLLLVCAKELRGWEGIEEAPGRHEYETVRKIGKVGRYSYCMTIAKALVE